MTEINQRAAEIVMAHIYGWTDDKQNKADIKFSRGALRAAVNMIDDSIGIIELKNTLDHLVKSKHLKKLAAHIYGLGTGKGLKRYPVNDKSLLLKPTDTGFNNSKAKHLISNQAAAPSINTDRKKPGPKPKPKQERADKHAEPDNAQTVSSEDKAIATKYEPPAFTGEENHNHRQANINQRLALFRKKIGRHQVKDMPIKINVLDQLADVIGDPDIASVLNDIKNDLQQGEAA